MVLPFGNARLETANKATTRVNFIVAMWREWVIGMAD
jgi:hypothetical protein